MDNIKIGSTIDFENGKSYVVFDSIVEDQTEYLYMATAFEPLEIMFAKRSVGTNNENGIITIGDREEKERVLQLLVEKAKTNNVKNNN